MPPLTLTFDKLVPLGISINREPGEDAVIRMTYNLTTTNGDFPIGPRTYQHPLTAQQQNQLNALTLAMFNGAKASEGIT